MKYKTMTQKGVEGNVIFLPKIYNETMNLLVESHDYFHMHGGSDQTGLDVKRRSFYCSEMSRITMRLSCIMAWLLARRAVSSDSPLSDANIGNYRLDCRDMCMLQNIEAEATLPPFMNHLLDKSYELYARVARLDDKISSSNASPMSTRLG